MNTGAAADVGHQLERLGAGADIVRICEFAPVGRVRLRCGGAHRRTSFETHSLQVA